MDHFMLCKTRITITTRCHDNITYESALPEASLPDFSLGVVLGEAGSA